MQFDPKTIIYYTILMEGKWDTEQFTPYTCYPFKVSENLTQRNLKSSLTPYTHTHAHAHNRELVLKVSSTGLVQDISGGVRIPHLSFRQSQAESCIAPSGHSSGLDPVQKSLSLAPKDLCVPLTGLHDRDILWFLWSGGNTFAISETLLNCPLALSPLTAAAM